MSLTPGLDYPSDGWLAYLTTLIYPTAWLTDGLGYPLEPGIDRLSYPSDG